MGDLLPSLARLRVQPPAPTKMDPPEPKRPRPEQPAGPSAFDTGGLLSQLALRKIFEEVDTKVTVPVARQFLTEQGMLVIGTQPPFPQFLQYGDVQIPLFPGEVSDDGTRVELVSGETVAGLDGKPIPYQHAVEKVYISVPPGVNAVELPMQVDDSPGYMEAFADEDDEDGERGLYMVFLAEEVVTLQGKEWNLQVFISIDLELERDNIQENYRRITDIEQPDEDITTWVRETATHEKAVVHSVSATLREL